MTNDKTIRVGFIGAGGNTRLHHIPKLKAQPGIELVAVANRTKESGERVAREFGIARVHGDWREIVEAKDVDAVCIGTWPYTHCEMTLAALAAGKHVLCEARMAMNAAEGRRMLDAARRAPSLVSQLVPAPHTLEVDSTIQRLLAEGYLGEVLAVELRPARAISSSRTRPCTGGRIYRSAATISSTWASGTRRCRAGSGRPSGSPR
jgi:predicted dehydrogenase